MSSLQSGLRFHCGVILLGLAAMPAQAVEPTPARGAPGEFSVSVSADFSSGDYGSSRSTSLLSVPVTMRYERGAWLGWLTVPWLTLSGPSDVVMTGGGGMGQRGGMGPVTDRTDSGLGDIVAGLSARLREEEKGAPAIDLVAKVIFGTADAARGLGTGENDYALQTDIVKTRDTWTWTGSLGYLVTGDPAGIDYRNVFYLRLDAETELDKTRSAGLALDTQQATTAAGDGPAKLTVYYSRRPDKQHKLTGSFLIGLSDASPDWGIGVTWLRFF